MGPAEAEVFLRATRRAGSLVEPFTDTHSELDEAWGYETQALDLRERLRTGESIVGAKLGLTSRAKQDRMGVDRPIVGFLTKAMIVDADEVAGRLPTWAQPRIEPEIAFITSHDIGWPHTAEGAHSCVDSVLLAAEILDSRFTDYRFRLPDVVADNTSAAGVVLGPERRSIPL